MTSSEIQDLGSLFARLRYSLAGVRLSLLERKYRPDQPRVPAGSSDGGRWAGSGSTPALIDIANRSDITLPIDLQAEKAAGGHAIERHVGRSNSDLVRTLQGERIDMPAETIFWYQEGSFNDLASANRYVNDVLDSNPAAVNAVASGAVQSEFLEKRYSSPTGREAYRDEGDPDGVVKLRSTYWVGVYIKHTANGRGFNVRTAYPKNQERSR